MNANQSSITISTQLSIRIQINEYCGKQDEIKFQNQLISLAEKMIYLH